MKDKQFDEMSMLIEALMNQLTGAIDRMRPRRQPLNDGYESYTNYLFRMGELSAELSENLRFASLNYNRICENAIKEDD